MENPSVRLSGKKKIAINVYKFRPNSTCGINIMSVCLEKTVLNDKLTRFSFDPILRKEWDLVFYTE